MSFHARCTKEGGAVLNFALGEDTRVLRGERGRFDRRVLARKLTDVMQQVVRATEAETDLNLDLNLPTGLRPLASDLKPPELDPTGAFN